MGVIVLTNSVFPNATFIKLSDEVNLVFIKLYFSTYPDDPGTNEKKTRKQNAPIQEVLLNSEVVFFF